ncbi:MAG TPA: DUF4743 domain-containing protein [Alphaproteobacteria bacterium]|nr:DUF4743 domain-containing protein [Alphaproteobacteria bacterium]
MHPLHRHIAINNNADLTAYAPLIIDGRVLGFMHDEVEEALKTSGLLRKTDDGYYLDAEENFESRTAALKKILAHLIQTGLISHERHELYAVAENFGDEPLALADRALMPKLGLAACGIHCNGYVRENGNIKLWVARRAPGIHVEPGKLDHIVAGGQPHGLSLRENLLKEAWEEAGIPKETAAKALAVGALRYMRAEPLGLRRDTLFLFDLELPPGFTPRNTDGEVSAFELMTTADVRRLMEETDIFKFNVPLVITDFFIRHGLIEPDEPGYVQLIEALR